MNPTKQSSAKKGDPKKVWQVVYEDHERMDDQLLH
jgi:hypothetical protein